MGESSGASGYDVVVVGGAATGSATAHHLRRLAPDLTVAVIERDPTYEHCSTLRSDGNVRVQFNLTENVAMSLYTRSLLDSFGEQMAVGDWRPHLAPVRRGNLFLTREEGRAAAAEGLAVQHALGCDTEWLDVEQIAARWPALAPARDSDIVGGTYGPNDGPIDPSALLAGFRRRAAADGADFLAGEVTAVDRAGGRVTGVRLASGEVVGCDAVVLAAGAWTAPIAATAGIELPVEPVMRTVHVVEHAPELGAGPSVFLPSGPYVLPEGTTRSQVSWSTADDPVGFDFTYRSAGFGTRVWGALVAALPAWDRLRQVGGWCGPYAVNTLDHNALLGAWPGLDGALVACGFSGHGLQHTPAMGRHLAELVTGRTPSIDLSRLSPARVTTGATVVEHAGRIV